MTDARIAVRPETRDLIRSMKRGGETYDELLQKMADQYENGALEKFRVPLVDTGNGDGWDVEVRAEDARGAMAKALEAAERNDDANEPEGDIVVASPFVAEHFELPEHDG